MDELEDYKDSITSNAFENKVVKGDYLMCCCPFHEESKPSFGINSYAPFNYNCFYCGGGNVKDLVRKITGENASEWIEDRFYNFKRVMDIDHYFPEPKKKESHYNTKGLIIDYTYLNSRGISNKVQDMYEIKYNPKSKSAVFPVRELNGNIKFYTERSTEGRTFNNEYVEKSDVLYGAYYFDGNTAWIVESPINVHSLRMQGINGAALLGCVMTEEHLSILKDKGIKHVIMCLDNDEAGIKGTGKAIKLLSTTSILVSKVVYNDTVKNMDCNDILRAGYKFNDVFKIIDMI